MTGQADGHSGFNTSAHPALRGIGPMDTGPGDTGDMGIIDNTMKHYRNEEVHWLDPGRIAMGKVNMIAGDPGLGKSFMTMELAARASRGEIGDPLAGVIIMSAEDDPCDTIAPRLRNMCANLSNIRFIEGIRREPGGPIDLLTLDRDYERFEQLIIDRFPVSLIVIDPISAYMGSADSNNNAEVRAVLARLSALAARTGAAVVCVTHLNKDTSGKRAVYRTMGSLAFTAAARTVQLVTKYETTEGHSDEQARDKRVVSMVKNNMGRMMPARVFIVRDPGICTWLDEEVDIDADQFASGRVTFDAPETKTDKAIEFLERVLDAGSQPAKLVLERGAALGMSRRVLEDAKKVMHAVSYKDGKVWYWSRHGRDKDLEKLLRDAIEPPATPDGAVDPLGYDDNRFM
jgi:putative DNA primase/helicase